MNVSRSGYYKWLNRKGTITNYKKNRIALAEEIKNIHKHHSTYGYRSIAQNIRNKTGWIFSDNLCHKVCKSLNIRSKARKTYIPRGEESITYPNIVNGNFNPSRPFEVIVSDTTIIHCRGKSYDWTYYIDVYNNEIIKGEDLIKKFYFNTQNNKELILEIKYTITLEKDKVSSEYYEENKKDYPKEECIYIYYDQEKYIYEKDNTKLTYLYMKMESTKENEEIIPTSDYAYFLTNDKNMTFDDYIRLLAKPDPTIALDITIKILYGMVR